MTGGHDCCDGKRLYVRDTALAAHQKVTVAPLPLSSRKHDWIELSADFTSAALEPIDVQLHDEPFPQSLWNLFTQSLPLLEGRGPMGNHKNKQDDKPHLLTSGKLDIGGVWFVAVALFAVLVAAIIVYRTADSLAF
jgi:hypothetical protein